MSTTATRMTAEEYFAATKKLDRRSQLIDGRMVANEPRPIHQVLLTRLVSALHVWTEAGDGRGLALPPVDVVMGNRDVYAPDVVWIAQQHVPADLTKRLPRVPDLCVEIRSPSTWRYDVGRKKSVYQAGGLPELWLVDHKSVLVFRRSDPSESSFDVELELVSGDSLTSPQLPGFALELSRLFRA